MAAAAAQRGRDYTAVNAMTVRWERDDTEAIKDSNNFQQMLKTLDVAPAMELVMRSSDSSPAITFKRAVLDLIKKSKAKTDKEHTIMIIHYAGHINQPPVPNAAYGTSKAMVHWLTRRINAEEEKINAFVANPGWCRTDMGNCGAIAYGWPEAPLAVSQSIAGVVHAIDEATKETHGGRL